MTKMMMVLLMERVLKNIVFQKVFGKKGLRMRLLLANRSIQNDCFKSYHYDTL